jgi:hypothetical protein
MKKHGIPLLLAALTAFLAMAVLPVARGDTPDPDWRAPVHVKVDPAGQMFLDGQPVDTLRVYRGQLIYWEKRDPAGVDLTIQFERTLFHKRNRVRVILTESGKARFLRVNDHARQKVYFGNPEKGFDPGRALHNSLQIRVISPPQHI